LSCWWKHFGDGRKLRILIARDDGEIVGIAPLMLSKYSFMRFGKLSKIEFVGSPHSDYNNFILLRKEVECLRLFLDHLVKNCSDWDYLQLRDIRENSRSGDLLCTMCDDDQPLQLERVVATLCPYIDLPDSVEAFMERLSQNMRRNLRKRMARLRRDYDVEFRTYGDFSSVDEAMKTFFELHQKRWRLKGEGGAFSSREFRDFHLNMARVFSEKGWLSLYFLMVHDEAAAAAYTFDYKLKKYGYLTGFDPEYYGYSVGNLLKMHIVEDCVRRGFREYDLMRDFEPYKADWASSFRRNLEVRMVRSGLFARIYDWVTKDGVPASLIQRTGASLSRN